MAREVAPERLVVTHPIPLHWAAANGRAGPLSEAITDEGDINRVDDDGYTALHHAVRHGNVDCVRLLLSSGADANAPTRGPTSQLQTPLHTAVKASSQLSLTDSVAIVNELLSAGAEPGTLNRASRSPFHLAVAAGAVELCAAMLSALPLPEQEQALISAPADGSAALSQPVHLAAARGDGVMLQWLLTRGADPRAKDARGRTPADVASAAGHSQVS